MAMTISKLNVAEISDVHLGHDKTSAAHIVKNLLKAFPDNEDTAELDIIWIAGDLFDRRLALPDDPVSDIKDWVHKFLRMCHKRDIMVRVLEGTPSHDWNQPKIMVEINENAKIGCDLKYINKLDIEYIEKFGIHVLYVPDEWRSENLQTWYEVKDLLKKNNLEKVDFSIMHGAFRYQIPSNIVDMFETHDTENYLGITRYLTFIGHIHQYSQYQRILSAGSFDRLHHGEEEPKGHIRAQINQDGTFKAQFVENKGAMVYKSIECTGVPLEDVYRQLDALVAKLPKHSYIRIIADTTDAVFKAGTELKTRYPSISITFKSNQTKTKIKPIITKDIIKPVNLSPDTIMNLMKESLDKNHGSIAQEAHSRLGEIMNEFLQ